MTFFCVYLLTDWKAAYVGRAVGHSTTRFGDQHEALRRFYAPTTVQQHILEFCESWEEVAVREVWWKQQIRESGLVPLWRNDVEWPIPLEARVRGGHTQGLRNTKPGHTDKAVAARRIWAAANPALVREHARRGGMIGGASGGAWMKEWTRTHPFEARENSRIGGVIGGRKGGRKGGVTQGNINRDNGHMRRIQLSATHVRWHVNRGIINPACPLCQ